MPARRSSARRAHLQPRNPAGKGGRLRRSRRRRPLVDPHRQDFLLTEQHRHAWTGTGLRPAAFLPHPPPPRPIRPDLHRQLRRAQPAPAGDVRPGRQPGHRRGTQAQRRHRPCQARQRLPGPAAAAHDGRQPEPHASRIRCPRTDSGHCGHGQARGEPRGHSHRVRARPQRDGHPRPPRHAADGAARHPAGCRYTARLRPVRLPAHEKPAGPATFRDLHARPRDPLCRPRRPADPRCSTLWPTPTASDEKSRGRSRPSPARYPAGMPTARSSSAQTGSPR